MRGRADRRVLRAMVGFRAPGTRLSPRSLVVVGFARRLSGVQAGASSPGAFAARGGSRGVARPVAGSGAARRPGGEPSPRAAAGADRGGMRGWRVRAFAQRGRSGSALLVSSETMASLPWRPRRNGVRLRRRVVRRFASGRGGVGGSGDGHGCGRDMRSAGEDRAARGVRGPRGGGRRLQASTAGLEGVLAGCAFAVFAVLCCLALNRLFGRTGRTPVGYGDVRCMAALSLASGVATPLGAALCYGGAAAFSLAGIAAGKLSWRSGIPMAPFLAAWLVGGACACLHGMG